MFQDTRSRQTQEDQAKEQQKRAQEAAAETQRRMQQESLTRMFDVERQNIDGKAREAQVAERRGASAGEVAAKTEANLMGSVDFDLSRHGAPSFLDDNRNEIRYNVRRAIMQRASEIEAQREERDKPESFAGKKVE